RRLRERVSAERQRLGLESGATLPGFGPGVGIRWWRLAAMVTLGLSAGVKWSGLYFAAGFLVLSGRWDASQRSAAGIARWVLGTAGRAAAPAFLLSLVTLPAAYLAAWTSWFVSQSSYMRTWAQRHPDEGVTWLPDTLRSFVEYHRVMWDFHTNLTEA